MQDKLQRRLLVLTQATSDQPVDDEAVYLNVAGECPKRRVYGLWSLGRNKRRYADPGASTSQMPEMVPCAKISPRLSSSLENGESSVEMVEALLAKQVISLLHRDTIMGNRKVTRNGFKRDLHSDPLEQETDDDNKDDKETMTLILNECALNHLQNPWHRALIFTVMERTIDFNYFSTELYLNWTTDGDIEILDIRHGYYIAKLEYENDYLKAATKPSGLLLPSARDWSLGSPKPSPLFAVYRRLDSGESDERHEGRYNRYDGVAMSWDERAVTSCTGGLVCVGSGFWLVAIYVKKRKNSVYEIILIIGSHSYAYTHRQRIINWIDGTGGLSTAFDFTTKGILQEAVKGELWRLRDPQGKPPGVMGWWPSRAIDKWNFIKHFSKKLSFKWFTGSLFYLYLSKWLEVEKSYVSSDDKLHQLSPTQAMLAGSGAEQALWCQLSANNRKRKDFDGNKQSENVLIMYFSLCQRMQYNTSGIFKKYGAKQTSLCMCIASLLDVRIWNRIAVN
ncbi:hypothetical protein Syun_019216 [Stephania yunnanensis]|uniref:1,4-alpha-D-glucan glucanohydrolase n=1 Tax=Stephania yunnanensis TaxID=152371 RepID=A0AAP0NX33_9MAGN